MANEQLFLNNFETTITFPVAPGDNTIRINNAASGVLLNPTAGDYYILTALKRSGSVETQLEIVKVTAVNLVVNPGEVTLTVVRAQEGTSAQSYIAGNIVALRMTRGGISNFQQISNMANAVLGQVLTGLSTATNAVITAADSVLTALGKLQKQITDLATTVGGKQNTLVSLTNIRTVNGNTLLGSTDIAVASLAGNTFTGAQIYSDQAMSRAMTRDMGMVFVDKGNSGTAAHTLDYTAASHQKLTVTGAFIMNAVTNWPPTGNTGELLLELVNGASSAITWTMAGTTQRWWKADGTFSATIGASGVTLQAAGTDWILMWSTDAGTTTNFKVMR